MIEEKVKKDPENKDEAKQQLKQFTPNGYKMISVMCFGEAAKEIVNLRYGVVVGFLNPRLLPKKDG